MRRRSENDLFFLAIFESSSTYLGSVDMLGNPFGLLNDVASGVDNLTRGNVIGFAKNVTRVVLDSASKVYPPYNQNDAFLLSFGFLDN